MNLPSLSRDAKQGLDDIFFFLLTYLHLDLEEQPHREMCEVLQKAETDSTKPYCMMVVPRGCYKTTIVRGAVVWKFLRQLYYHDNPYHRIVIASATLAHSRMSLTAIGNTMRYGGWGGRLNEDYIPLWRNRDKERAGSKVEDGIVIAPRIEGEELAAVAEPSVFIGSMRRISTGFHADEAVLDDLNNKDNTSTPQQRMKTHEYWRLMFPILGTADRSGQPCKITMPCTPWHDDDVRGLIIREETGRIAEDSAYISPWNMICHPAINEDGTPFFPTKYPLDRLERLRIDMGPREFAANYECDPIGSAGLVNEEDIRFHRPSTFPSLQQGRITVDPAFHQEAKDLGCYSAITVVAYDRFARMYVLDARGSREWTTHQFIDAMFRVHEDYPNWPLFMEDSHMSYFRLAVQMEEAHRSQEAGHPVRLPLYYVPVDVKRGKEERWNKLLPRFEKGQVIFSDEIAPSIKAEIKSELVRGIAGRFKDFLDALAMAETGVMPKTDRTGAPVAIADKTKQEPNVLTFRDVFGKRVAS